MLVDGAIGPALAADVVLLETDAPADADQLDRGFRRRPPDQPRRLRRSIKIELQRRGGEKPAWPRCWAGHAPNPIIVVIRPWGTATDSDDGVWYSALHALPAMDRP